MVHVHFELFVFLLFLYQAFTANSQREFQCEVRTRIESGWICGARRLADDGSEYASFRGVPYAKQPMGELRFQELRPATPWEHYLDATQEGPNCPQHDETYGRLIWPTQGSSEACIYANIHVPIKAIEDSRGTNHRHRKGKGLPIAVFIHGGGFHSGSGDSDLNGPEYLLSRNVILITFNYRLNVFGFLSLNHPKIPGNQGLRDQVTLLRWVQRNARAFGGDPDNVTLMGQSAGASCAHLLSLSKATEGLFKRVILMSGVGNPGFFSTSPLNAKFIAALFLSKLGINSTDPDEIHDQLLNMPLRKILIANSEVQYITGIISFSPVEEMSFPGVTRILDDDPTELVKRGRGNQYPLIIGFTTAECEFFRPRLIYIDIVGRIEANPTMVLSPRIVFRTPPNISLQLARRVIRRYFKDRLTYDEYVKCCADTFFVYPAFQLADLRSSMAGAPVYLYRYSYVSQFSEVKEAGWLKYKGAAHVEDLVRVLRENTVLGKQKLRPKDGLMKDWMTDFVVNFTRCSNPTCAYGDRSPWPPVHENALNYQRIHNPRVYSNSGPTPRQWDMIELFNGIETDSRRARAGTTVLTVGSPDGETFLNNMSAEAIDVKRPNYPLAIVYREPHENELYFNKLN